jgi:hypothetical protein
MNYPKLPISNHCDIELGNYSTAIAWYEDVITNPPTYPDSLFAIIDLGNLYIEMQNDSLKSAPIGSMAEYKPQSIKQYTVYRDYLLSLLHKSADAEKDSEMELNDEKTIKLLPNTPNPFIRSTSLRYIMKEEAYVEIEIFDYTGRHIKTLNEGLKKVGQHNVAFVAESMKPGIYFCTIRCNGKITDTQKITLIK